MRPNTRHRHFIADERLPRAQAKPRRSVQAKGSQTCKKTLPYYRHVPLDREAISPDRQRENFFSSNQFTLTVGYRVAGNHASAKTLTVAPYWHRNRTRMPAAIRIKEISFIQRFPNQGLCTQS